MTKKQKNMLARIILSIIILAGCVLVLDNNFNVAERAGISWIMVPFFLVPYLIAGYDILIKAIKGIFRGRLFDENFLMATATVGAFALGEYLEGVAVMVFYQIGELFQGIAVGKSRRNISDLMDIRPEHANLEIDGSLSRVNPDSVPAGSVILVKSGERIPLDGIVVEGSSLLDTKALTGESIPRKVSVNDEVMSGCVNLSGVLRIRTSKEFGESAVSRILDLVENASSKKSRAENFITRFAKYYTPLVCIGALVVAVVPPFFVSFVYGQNPDFIKWIYRALSFLVISCPCALVVSIPLSFFAGIGKASSKGILVKGASYLELLSSVKTVVFDKTGTLTKGTFCVTEINPIGMDRHELLSICAHMEIYSDHPVAVSIRNEYEKDLDAGRVSQVEEVSGHGIRGFLDGKKILAGNSKLMESEQVDFSKCEDKLGTIIYVSVDSKYAGYIIVSDQIKDDSRRAVQELKKIGITRTVMLTGDLKKSAEIVAREIGVDEFYAELLPQDKVSKLEEILMNKYPKTSVAFVGDGINDAPVLSRSDVGISMGALGSDAAIEASDIVLMDDNPLCISKAVGISRKCMAIVHENIVFAIGIKLLCLVLGALGFSGMWFAIFADVGVMVLAVLNAIRVLFGYRK